MVSQEEVAQSLIKLSGLFAVPYETEFDPRAHIDFAASNWKLCFVLVFGYLLVVFSGRSIMSKREPFDLKYVLAFWNACLSLFSFVGMWRTVS
jgi:hypothetical protein